MKVHPCRSNASLVDGGSLLLCYCAAPPTASVFQRIGSKSHQMAIFVKFSHTVCSREVYIHIIILGSQGWCRSFPGSCPIDADNFVWKVERKDTTKSKQKERSSNNQQPKYVAGIIEYGRDLRSRHRAIPTSSVMKQSYVVDFSQFLNTSRTGEHPVHAVRLARPRPSNSKPNQTCVKYKSLYRSLDLNSIIVLVSTMHLQTRNLGFLTVHQFWLTVFATPPPGCFW